MSKPILIFESFLQKTGSVYVLWTTHHPRGLSSKDTFMARFCDEQAGLIGDVDKSAALLRLRKFKVENAMGHRGNMEVE
jgi:hypothetical protein